MGNLEKKMETHSSILAWEIQWTEKPGGLQSIGLQTVKSVTKKQQYMGDTQENWVTHQNGWVQFSSVHLLSCVWLSATPWTTACQASLIITNSWTLLKLMSTESVMPSNNLILCHSLLLLPSIFPSIRERFFGKILVGKTFPTSQFFPSGGQSIAVSDLASFHQVNIQDWLFTVYNQ